MLQRKNGSDRNDDVFSADLALQRDKDIEREILTCCYCDAPLEPLMLETDEKTGEQRLMWACRNMRKQTCFFPMGLPSKVFFLTRSAAEKEDGVIPKPDIHRLPKKYWGLYPTVFADKLKAGGQASDARAGTSLSNNPSDYSPCPTNSTTTSGSSVSSDNAAVDQLLKMGSDASVWGNSAGRQKNGTTEPPCEAADKDSSNRSMGTDSSSTYSSSSEKSTNGVLAELICHHLQYTGVDIGRLEDEELVSKMAGVVKKLHKEKISLYHKERLPGKLSQVEYSASLDYLFNLDVAPIKRRLGVLSTELTRAVAVMRSKCDIDTMLEAMGGSTPPPTKRSKPISSKQEFMKRVEAILKSMSASEKESEVPACTSAVTADGEEDPSGGKEWYEGEDGPSTSDSQSVPATDSNLAEEERLNAIVQSKVRSYLVKSAAKRHANRLKRMQESSLQVQEAQPHVLSEPLLPLHSNISISTEHLPGDEGLLSFDSPYADNLGEDVPTLSFPQEDLVHQPNSSVVQNISISETTHSHDLDSNLDLHSSVGDDEFTSLFGHYDFM